MTSAMDSVTAPKWQQKARWQRNGDGNSKDGDDDSDEDGGDGDGWRNGDGQRDGNKMETAAMGGATAHNRSILNLCSNLFVITRLSICSSQLIHV